MSNSNMNIAALEKEKLIEILEVKLKALEAILSEVEQSLKSAENLPDLRVRITGSEESKRYYLCERHKCANGHYLRMSEQEIVPKLLQRDYDREMKAAILKQIAAIERFLKAYHPKSLQRPYELLSSVRRDMIHPYVESDEEYIRNWLGEKYVPKEISDEVPVIYTERGERVRSKSEKILADKFYSRGIPYKYERPLRLKNGIVIYPDFTVLNVRTREEFYVEHFGMMDDENYSQMALKRVNEYILSGIFPGKQLLITYESRKSVLDMKVVDLLIEEYLI